jgi:predicted transcriptional regulator
MSIISLRLSKDLDHKLAREAELANKARSEIAREAIAEYLARLERDRFIAQIARAARARGTEEALAIAHEALPHDNEALDLAEGRTARQPKTAYRARKVKRR